MLSNGIDGKNVVLAGSEGKVHFLELKDMIKTKHPESNIAIDIPSISTVLIASQDSSNITKCLCIFKSA